MLKSLRAEIQRTRDEILEHQGSGELTMILISVVDASAEGGAQDLPCVGHCCDYHLAGERRRLYFPGDDPEPMARALLDHAHRIEGGGKFRPVPVFMPQQEVPVEAVTITAPPEGLTHAEHAARLYGALRTAA